MSSFGGQGTRLGRPITALLLEIFQDVQTSESGGDIARPCVPQPVGEASFGEPDLGGGNRADTILEGCGRCTIVNLPVTPLEPPVDGRCEPKTRWQEGKDCSDQSIVVEHGIAIAVVAVPGSHRHSGLVVGVSLLICAVVVDESPAFICCIHTTDLITSEPMHRCD
jgi:hypothetical protein